VKGLYDTYALYNAGEKAVKWKRISVPEEVYRALKEEAEKQGVAVWKVLLDVLAGIRAKKGRKPLSKDDAIVWYVYKFAASVGEYRGSPTEENLKKLEETCWQLRERLGINVDDFLSVARQYDGSHSARKVLNDAAKDVVARILSA
jgi:hypothetical protein